MIFDSHCTHRNVGTHPTVPDAACHDWSSHPTTLQYHVPLLNTSSLSDWSLTTGITISHSYRSTCTSKSKSNHGHCESVELYGHPCFDVARYTVLCHTLPVASNALYLARLMYFFHVVFASIIQCQNSL